MSAAVKLDIKSNIKQFTKGLDNIGKRQIPFVTNQTLSNTLYRLRMITLDTMKNYIDRPSSKTQKVLYQSPKNKKALPIGYLYFTPEVSKWLKWSIHGGMRPLKKGRVIPVNNAPTDKLGGVPNHQRILSRSRAMKSRFINDVGIWQRAKKGGKAKLLYMFEKKAVKYKKTFPFFERMNLISPKIFNTIFKKNLARAIERTKELISSGKLKI